jgi:hypothetical protein
MAAAGGNGDSGRGYDRVELRSPTGEPKLMTRVEFERLPLDQRIRAILSKRLRFYRGGREVSMKEALEDR